MTVNPFSLELPSAVAPFLLTGKIAPACCPETTGPTKQKNARGFPGCVPAGGGENGGTIAAQEAGQMHVKVNE
jgi:hypothetical protein